MLLPDFITARQLVSHLGARLPEMAPQLTDADREALLGVCCRAAAAAGFTPPFRLRPGLIAEILRFYDALRRHEKDVDAFERLALGMLEPGAELDRGAARLVQQTRFLVAAFREFERRSLEAGLDEHQLAPASPAAPADRTDTATSSSASATRRSTATGFARRTGICCRDCRGWNASTSS